jgi:hypothetical protein
MPLLEPDVNQIEIFVQGMFRHCGKDGVVSLRAFVENSNKNAPPVRITDTKLSGGLRFLMAAAEDDARRAANHPQPVVFCPPVATFLPTGHAGEDDLLEGIALSVELDQNPGAALATLEHLLGFATLVVRSGGEWTNPATGEVEDKLHAHWRLNEPATGKANLDKLKRAREIATKLVDGDPSNIPICHPIRWPGSWHRKAAPRLCEILNTDHLDNEIDLDLAIEALEAVAPQAGGQQQTGQQQAGGTQGSFETLDWDKAFGEIISGKKFHPVLTPLSASFAACGVPEAATRWALRALLNNTTTTDPGRLKRRDAELAKLKDTVRSGYDKFATEVAIPKTGELFDPWQEFIAPPFPLDVLPESVFEFVLNKSDAMGVDRSAIAMSMLTAASGAIHHRFRMKMKSKTDWREHVRLWTLLIGRSSWKKNPTMDATTWPLEYYQADVMRDHRAEMRDYKAKVKAGDKNAKEPEPPERFIVGDITTEKLGEILSRSERGVLAVYDEVAGWIGRMERYHGSGKGASADRAFWLRSWTGGHYSIDRINSGENLVRNLSVSILAGIQPRKLAEIHGLTSDGLLQRFLPVLMKAPRLPIDIDCTEVNRKYKDLFYQLIALPPQQLRVTDAAIEVMDELQRHLFNLEQVGEALSEGFEGYIGKLAAYAGALTIILHLLDDPKNAVKNFIGKPVVEKVDQLIRDFLIPHGVKFYATGEGTTERLQAIASYVLRCGKDRLRLTEFTNNVRDCRGKTVREVNEQVSPLVAGGWLDPIGVGPAYRAWDVNRAAIDAQFADQSRTEQERKKSIRQLIKISAAQRRNASV